MRSKKGEDGHKHAHGHHHHSASKNIAVAFFLNISFTIIEFIGGFLTNSVAIISDAVHDLGDSFSLALSWYFEKVAKRSPNKKYTYGYKRFSLLGAVINSTILLVGSAFVIIESVKRVMDPQEVHAKGMLLLAVLGVVINGIAVLKTRKGEGVNERVVSLHLLEDVLGWAAVLVVSIVMIFVDVPILDPLLSIGIAIFILYNVYRNLKTSLNVMLQGVPDDVNVDHLKKKLLLINEIEAIHDFHVWSMDSQYNVASMHVVLKRGDMTEEILKRMKIDIKGLMKTEGIQHTTIEFEGDGEECDPCYSEGI
ncbi:cation diffusion facilitator family transporter [Bacteroidales bacterium OttesenSCG-928-B11]|nr:cation diffusion facilitator family transporter [Bacteroidales bacterium OttesenSCG-928-E04]MDL2313049.1 cation diffusion facilitator family transporter [Bacteroidales bacterium OttesenSCG-928-B11]MDL2326731.1 cation diffusion facilitator family transporter [Bacteroidales bacterium OttesenSCG-928-A14]